MARVAIVGTGFIGRAWAISYARAGHDVTLWDAQKDAARAALGYIDQLLPDLAYLRGDMQVAHMVHATAAVLMIALFAGHIYMGTIGMKGAYAAMRTGFVDEAWGDEHHALWMDDIRAGKIPAQRSEQPAPVSQASARPT